VADGLTKAQVRQKFADLLSRGTHALRFDPSLAARKKWTEEELQAQNVLLNEAEKLLQLRSAGPADEKGWVDEIFPVAWSSVQRLRF